MFDLFSDTTDLKAISLWQPWASLIAAGLKRHETRHWPTEHRGPIAIHAAKRMDVAGAPEELCIAAFGPNWRDILPMGAMVAVARLTHCRNSRSVLCSLTRADREAGNFAPGRYAWRLEGVRPLSRPIETIGRQGLFNWSPPEDLEARLDRPLDHEQCCRYLGWER